MSDSTKDPGKSEHYCQEHKTSHVKFPGGEHFCGKCSLEESYAAEMEQWYGGIDKSAPKTSSTLPAHLQGKTVPDNISKDSPAAHPNILALLSNYCNAKKFPSAVKPMVEWLFLMLGCKIATEANLDLYRKAEVQPKLPFHLGPQGRAFIFPAHTAIVAEPGDFEGVSFDIFFDLIRDIKCDKHHHALWPHELWGGGSIESFRGSLHPDTGKFRGSVVERTDRGFSRIPELWALLGRAKQNGGTLQDIIAWMDSFEMSVSLVGGHYQYCSSSTIFGAIQARPLLKVLADENNSGLRRRFFFLFVRPQDVDEMIEENRLEPSAEDETEKQALREALLQAHLDFRPDSIDWTEVDDWFEEQLHVATLERNDKQHAHGIALSYYILAGGERSGSIKIHITPGMKQKLDELVQHKCSLQELISQADNEGLSRIQVVAVNLLKVPENMGKGQEVWEKDVRTWIQKGFHLRTQTVARLLNHLILQGDLKVMGQKTAGRFPSRRLKLVVK